MPKRKQLSINERVATEIMGWPIGIAMHSDDGVFGGWMPPDATIAELGRGWCNSVHSEGGTYPYIIPGDPCYVVPPKPRRRARPLNSFDPEHALGDCQLVIDRMRALGFWRVRFELSESPPGKNEERRWWAHFEDIPHDVELPVRKAYDAGPTLPAAICAAVLEIRERKG